ncbi:uncharacterized protein LOC119069082 isoform X2 [Bradysia coprophila]|uniref:uncharacterized protein LOC119069082 isoform X2 n=1 Tax=Bradysia coprophila TaxID=38358 RepID=UPI00187D7263|nr:uncharacterized protein LOC119069082 isoform X2 [Bradysia coprophila]
MYCICILWTNFDVNQIDGINFEADANYPNMIWMKYEASTKNRTNVDQFVRIGIENYCQAFIVTPNSAVDFLISFEAVRYSTERRYSSTYVVALPSNLDENKNYIDDVSQQKSVEDIPNLLIISPTRGVNGTDMAYDLITTQIDNRNNHSSLQTLDTFNVGQFYANANLFPDKLFDLKGQPLRMSIFNYPPYNVWWEVPPGTGNANLDGSEDGKSLFVDGTETLLALEFCKLYNCTLHIVIDEEHTWGTVYDNGTGDGSLGNTYERRSDIGVGGQYSWHQFHFFLDLSAPFTRSAATVMCPKPKQRIGLVLLVLPFSNMMWAAEFATLFACIMAIILARLASSRLHREQPVVSTSSTWFEVWAISLLQSRNFVLRHLPETIITVCALISSMLIASAYSGELAGMTTVPQFEEPIDTNRQFAERKMKWGAWHHAWVTSLEDAPDPIVEYLFNSFELISTEALGTRPYSDDFCYPLETLQYGHFAIGDFLTVEKTSFLRLIRDDFYWGHVVAYQYKTWPLKNLYDMHVLYVVQSGLFKYWETCAAAKYQNWKVQLAIATSRRKDKPMPISLQIDHMSGVFIIWGIGCGISTAVFVSEIFFVRFYRKIGIPVQLEGLSLSIKHNRQFYQ